MVEALLVERTSDLEIGDLGCIPSAAARLRNFAQQIT